MYSEYRRASWLESVRFTNPEAIAWATVTPTVARSRPTSRASYIRGIGINLQSPVVVSGVALYRDGLSRYSGHGDVERAENFVCRR